MSPQNCVVAAGYNHNHALNDLIIARSFVSADIPVTKDYQVEYPVANALIG